MHDHVHSGKNGSRELKINSKSHIFLNFLVQFKDGKFNKVAFINLGKLVAQSNEEMKKVVLEIADECEGAATSGDRCENGVLHMTCLYNAFVSRNLPITVT